MTIGHVLIVICFGTLAICVIAGDWLGVAFWLLGGLIGWFMPTPRGLVDVLNKRIL